LCFCIHFLSAALSLALTCTLLARECVEVFWAQNTIFLNPGRTSNIGYDLGRYEKCPALETLAVTISCLALIWLNDGPPWERNWYALGMMDRWIPLTYSGEKRLPTLKAFYKAFSRAARKMAGVERKVIILAEWGGHQIFHWVEGHQVRDWKSLLNARREVLRQMTDLI
jgi:hypothetical protein